MLIVDDVADNRAVLGRRFERRGAVIVEADCGPAALQLIEENGGFDVVLLDSVMPGMDGLAVLKAIRETLSAAELPVIMVTAKAEPSDMIEALNNGANDYVTKPVNFAVAEARVSTHVARKRAEDEARRVTAGLQQTVEALEAAKRDLEESRIQAEAANRAKSAFLATMSHEMRTPLNGIVAMADLLARADLPAQQREMAEIILSASKTLDALTADILDLARIEAGAVAVALSRFNVRDTVQGVVDVLRLKAAERELSFDFEADPSTDVWVEGDALKLKQIVTNLASNAVKFTEEGGVAVAVRRTDAAFEVEVSDTGIGVKPGDEGRIFERFQQADGTITRRFGGAGLGLSISRELAGLMGGALSYRERRGGGSIFTVRLPLVPLADQPAPAAREPAVARPAAGARPIRILIVDDNATNRRVVELILASPFVEMVSVENGEEAVGQARDQHFDMVLMDMQMPVMDGLAATRMIRRDEQERGLKRTPIIMLTANAMPEHVEAALTAGADWHMPKPVNPDRLLAAVLELQTRLPEAAQKLAIAS
jgi:signal transduction histidine kinase